MDNQSNYPPSPYPYNPNPNPNPPYGYTHNRPPPIQYPPPNSVAQSAYPPPVSNPYPYPQHYPAPYTNSHSGHLNYPYPSPSPSPAPPPGPHRPPDYNSYPYLYHAYPSPPPPQSPAPPQPNLQTYGSFQYGSFHYLHHQPSGRLQPPPDAQSEIIPPRLSSDYTNHHHSASSVADSTANSDRVDDSFPSYPPVYPPIDDQMANVRLSDSQNKPSSVPASPPAVDAAPQKFHSGPLPMTNNNHDGSGTIYGYRNNSFSNWETSSVGKVESLRPNTANIPCNASMQLVQASSPKTSLKVLLLHGNLDIWVYGEKPPKHGHVPQNHWGYVQQIARTYVISNDENPVWMQNFVVAVAHNAAEVNFVVKDNDVVGSQHIGTVSIPVEHIYGGGKYNPIEQLSIYHHGIGAGPDYTGVSGTYFPLRRGGTVTLYQDAHVPDGSLPNLKLDNGTQYMHGKCWRDIFDAIRHARRLIYITGWSVWHKVRLVRDDNSLSDYTLGELLKSKSQEGVRVLLLIWDDPTSRSILGYKTDGVMQTHDEETRRFFKHSSVQVLLCPRVAGKRHSWVKQREVGVIYTHHQKTVVVDADAGNNRRRIIAFLGGLDLCDGRYDTPQHPIFRTLQTLHSDDYHNPTYAGNVAGCPREPWHDLHCKIDGPAAYDVLSNFEERWLKASKPHGIKKLKMSYDDALLRIERMPEILGLSDAPCVSDDDPEGWHVQISKITLASWQCGVDYYSTLVHWAGVCSIDSNSVKGFPKDPKEGTMRNLAYGKNVLIDMSIHSAYIKAIRGAQHFIYIENQYFIGSSYNWNQYKDAGANNLIPMEIALKIAETIRAHERFAAYIVIPMWPEGNPTGAATQRILFWQHKTMQMMYETIYKALVEVGLEDAYSPQDYLNFYCLGNREALDANDLSDAQPAANNPQGLSRKNRRFMIYVHSKGMIVDDEYVILGSANINQRSMEGTRDTEIAMGAYQPHHTWAKKLSSPQGQIYGYRMSLWAEHLGFLEECFTRPSLWNVFDVRSMGEANWEQFASLEVSEMRGHLLKYPVEVDRKGKVKPLPGHETFPDVGGNIVGSLLAIQENLTI
ncbi:hypothetical protein DH2020_002268 [Rehmannia glutinosa]|uniref:phospholipase D n=1 Tax=Rehmannia glutinosa TaxID=99300 RepID=A0ABR0XT96_REHGL